jgi:hypothetical protein
VSKESTERGLGVRFHGAPRREKAKGEKKTKRGVFVPDTQDDARLLARFVGAPRRMS